jgi:hypothetical protein
MRDYIYRIGYGTIGISDYRTIKGTYFGLTGAKGNRVAKYIPQKEFGNVG